MSNRHLVRSIVLQSLFEWDFKEEVTNIDSILQYNIEAFAPTLSFRDDFLQFLSKGVVRNIKKIDKIIKVYAPEWPINQISTIDRNILRIAIFELVYSSSTPYKVVVNEAIELAKNFSGEKSSKFINGVLGSVITEINKNIEKIYEIGFVIKNPSNNYLLIKKDDKFKFFRIQNEIKNAIEKENDEKFLKEVEEIKKKKEEKLLNEEINKPELDKNEVKEEIVESDEIENKEEISIEDNNVDKYIDFASQKLKETFKIDSLSKIENVDEISYFIMKDEDKKSLFPSIQLKNIIFIFAEINNDLILPKENNFIWVDKEQMLSSMEYKNIKNVLNKIIEK